MMIFAIILVGCNPSRNQDADPALEEVPLAETAAKREAEKRDAAKYRERLKRAPKYRSELRDMLIDNPAEYRNSGNTGLGEFWYGRDISNMFGCVHPVQAITRAQKDGWQLVRCNEYTAFFLRGPSSVLAELPEKRVAPILEEKFDILRLTFGSPWSKTARGIEIPPKWILYRSMPGFYEEPSELEILESGFTPEIEDEVRVSNQEYRRRREVSFYDASEDRVVTLIYRGGEFSGGKVISISDNFVISIQTPTANYAETISLLKSAKRYVGDDT